ncbi:TPA: hypothetical protein QB195_002199, partial [Pasteurella multocida]|nr:hypothetical protein [Pasteurella multocida]
TEKSKYLYYSESIDEFTKLFSVKNDEFAEIISTKIITTLEDNKSELYSKIVNSLYDVYWDTSAVYSENLYCCDADVISHYFRSFSVQDSNIWKSDKESATWVLSLELLFDLELEIEAESYARDCIDKELVSMGFSQLSVDVNPEFQFHIICYNINIDSDCSDWDIEIKLINEQYTLDEIGISHSFE